MSYHCKKKIIIIFQANKRSSYFIVGDTHYVTPEFIQIYLLFFSVPVLLIKTFQNNEMGKYETFTKLKTDKDLTFRRISETRTVPVEVMKVLAGAWPGQGLLQTFHITVRSPLLPVSVQGQAFPSPKFSLATSHPRPFSGSLDSQPCSRSHLGEISGRREEISSRREEYLEIQLGRTSTILVLVSIVVEQLSQFQCWL